MYQITFYVPKTHLDTVKQAMFAAGAGKIGNYDQCCWQVLGQGQFRPLAGSNPYSGQIHQLETEQEYKVEMVCEDKDIQAIILALKQSHPYEEPAYAVWKLADVF